MTIFESLDYIYVPAPNIEESISYYTKVLDGELLWKIHAYGVWVACVNLLRLTEKQEEKQQQQPYILLANHIEKKDLMLIYRVKSLEKSASKLSSLGWEKEKSLEIPNGTLSYFS
jgi:hypothetical protein